jgi:hypothetical protein
VAHPVRLVVLDDLRRARLTVALRLLMALPHLAVVALWAAVVAVLLPAQWLLLVIRGRSVRPLDAVARRSLRYVVRVCAYLLLLAEPWPPVREGGYAVEVELCEVPSQQRLAVLLRPLLALPAVVFASVLVVVALSVAAVAWFAALVSARMPPGLEELGLYCLGFGAQTAAYGILLTETYPSLAGATHVGVVNPPTEAG